MGQEFETLLCMSAESEPGVIFDASQSGASTSTGTEVPAGDPAPAQEQSGGFLGGSIFNIVIFYAAIIGLLYFFSMRPQKKREKQIKEMQEAISSGDRVITAGGFYGKVVDVMDDSFMIEFGSNKGVRIQVRRTDVFKAPEPSETESK